MKSFLAASAGVLLLLSSNLAAAFLWPSAPDEVARALSSNDLTERRNGAARLRELPSAVAADLVFLALADEDSEVRLSAASASIELGLPGSGERVITWLGDSDVRLRLSACEVIRQSPTTKATPQLTRALGDANAEVRLAAASTLGSLGDPEGVGPILGHLDDPSPEVRAGLVLALGRLADARAVVPLLGKVQDGSADVRRVAVRVLGDLGDAKATSVLLLALRDKVVVVQIEAIDSLGRLRSTESASAIASLVTDRSAVRVRRAAIASLGRIGNPVAIDSLIGALAVDDPGAERSDVRDALVLVGEPAVAKLLESMQGGSSREVASGACLVLAEAGLARHSSAVVEAMHRGQVPASVGLRALAKLGDTDSLPAVLELLDSPSGPVRRAAISAATLLLDPKKPDGRAVEPISALLTNPKVGADDRVLLTQLLGRTGSARASKVLISLALSPDERLRAAAISSLGLIGSAGQDGFLISLLDDEKAEVRLAAALSLSKVASGATAPELFRRLTQASEQDRGAVGIALSGAMERSQDAALVERVREAIQRVGEPNRDVLIEGLGRMGTPSANTVLEQLSRSAQADDRRKVAEALGIKGGRLDVLRRLAQDTDPSVQANAVWSIGQVGEAADLAVLSSLLTHRDAAVAGNSVAAVGMLIGRGKAGDESQLCKALDDPRSYVRANALASLGATRHRCGDGSKERAMLLSDGSSMVRERAASMIRAVGSSQLNADQRALRRCMYDDRSGAVAQKCSERGRVESRAGEEPLLVFVVPEGKNQPQARAGYSLILAGGQVRMGIADRRGAVFEARAGNGEVSLGVPVSLAR